MNMHMYVASACVQMYHKVVTLLLYFLHFLVVLLFVEFQRFCVQYSFSSIFRSGIAESEGMNVFKALDINDQVAF